MEYSIRVIIFLLLVVIQIISDNNIQKCDNKLGKSLIILHHFTSIYIYFGSIILGYHLLHIIFLIIAFLSFIIYYQCPLTVWHNELCNNDKLFNTYINIIFGNENAKNIHIILIILFIIYDIYYVNKKYKFIR